MSEDNKSQQLASRSRRSGRSRKNTERVNKSEGVVPPTRGLTGGAFKPLSQTELQEIDQAIRHILENIGFADAPPIMVDTVCAHGGKVLDNGRLSYPEPLINEFLDGYNRDVNLYSRNQDEPLQLSGQQVYTGTGGASPQVVDMETGKYRDSTLKDLYDAARLADYLDHIHFFNRSLVARDMPDERSLDINTAYACLAGTSKHVCTSISHPDYVPAVADIIFSVSGGHQNFAAQPTVSLLCNHVVPPLRMHKESCEVLYQAALLGIPIHCNVFSQVGASTPVTLAGAMAQNAAEALGGMIFGWLANPDVITIMGVRPMLTDLRTGGFSGGSGEQAMVMAATAQLACYYDLPNSCIAGATDSKVPDAQSGYEKAMTVTLAAQAGSNMITQACGVHAGLMSIAFESMVIDNDMLGSILRSIHPIEVSGETLGTDAILEVVTGEGHFLGHSDTYKRMQSDFLYPEIADRQSPEEWEAAGSPDFREVAKQKAADILNTHYPVHIPPEIDTEIRSKYDIRLPMERMASLSSSR